MTLKPGDARSSRLWLDPPQPLRTGMVVAYLAVCVAAALLGSAVASSSAYPIDQLQLAGTAARAVVVRGDEPASVTREFILGDFVFIIAYAAVFGLGLGYFALPKIRWAPVHRLARLFGWLLGALVVFDIAENIAILVGLGGNMGDPPWVVARIAAAFKFVVFFDIVVYVMVAMGGFLARPEPREPTG